MEDTPKLTTLAEVSWIPSWLQSLRAKLPAGLAVDDAFALTLGEADQDACSTAASLLHSWHSRSIMVIRMTNRLLGELILQYASKFNLSTTDAIEALGLPTSERSIPWLRNLTRIVQKLPSDVLNLEGLTHSHFEAAVAFRAPEEPDKAREWNLRIRDILLAAAECPEQRPAKFVSDSIRAMQKEFGIVSRNPESAKALLDQYATINYILEHWTEDQFEGAGHDRSKMLDYREQIENDLINRGILTIPDPANFVPPWRLRTEPEAPIDVFYEEGTGTLPEQAEALRSAADDELPILE